MLVWPKKIENICQNSIQCEYMISFTLYGEKENDSVVCISFTPSKTTYLYIKVMIVPLQLTYDHGLSNSN